MGCAVIPRAFFGYWRTPRRFGWVGSSYDLVNRNCCHFADSFARKLGVGGIPDWINRLGRTGTGILQIRQNIASAFEGLFGGDLCSRVLRSGLRRALLYAGTRDPLDKQSPARRLCLAPALSSLLVGDNEQLRQANELLRKGEISFDEHAQPVVHAPPIRPPVGAPPCPLPCERSASSLPSSAHGTYTQHARACPSARMRRRTRARRRP